MRVLSNLPRLCDDLIVLYLTGDGEQEGPGVVIGRHFALGGQEPEGLEQRGDDEEESVLGQDLPRARPPSSSEGEESERDATPNIITRCSFVPTVLNPVAQCEYAVLVH